MTKDEKMRSLKKILIRTIGVIVLVLIVLFLNNRIVRSNLSKSLDDDNLSAEEVKAAIDVIQILKLKVSEIWPISDGKFIPFIIFNEQYEFLISQNVPIPSWELIDSTSIPDFYISIRQAISPKSFAVKVEENWMGSIGTRRLMNKQMMTGMDKELPFFITALIPFNFLTIKEDFHVALIIHEINHAHQAIQSIDKFKAALASYSIEKTYPYWRDDQKEAWTTEGNLLFEAMNATSSKDIVTLTKRWLKVREGRRSKLDSKLITFEKNIEWLEGLSRYVEIKAYSIARTISGLNFEYKDSPIFWDDGQNKLRTKLGKVDRDERFYLSGMAQAMILDSIYPAWKMDINKDSVYFEDLIKRSLNR